MSQTQRTLTSVERRFEPDEIIVAKTNAGGRITYANPTFLRVSSLTEREAIGEPHNLIRHPGMPASIFRLLWTTIQQGQELFAYVLNRATNGDHSNRRAPDPRVVTATIEPLYRELRAEERRYESKSRGIDAALARLQMLLADKGTDYERFVFSLQR